MTEPNTEKKSCCMGKNDCSSNLSTSCCGANGKHLYPLLALVIVAALAFMLFGKKDAEAPMVASDAAAVSAPATVEGTAPATETPAVTTAQPPVTPQGQSDITTTPVQAPLETPATAADLATEAAGAPADATPPVTDVPSVDVPADESAVPVESAPAEAPKQ